MRRALFVLAAAVAPVGACTSGGSDPIGGADGGTSSSGGGGSSSGTAPEKPATPQAIVRFNGGAAAGCARVPAFNVGQFADATAHRAVKSGEVDEADGQSVTVTCQVAPRGSDFLVSLFVTKGTTNVSIDDTVDAKGASQTAWVTLQGGGAAWSSKTCTLDASGVQMGVAAGRYWAMVTCMGATSVDGETCDIFGEIRVENCTPN